MNSYFSHDSNARNSSKMLQVRMKLGAIGYAIYFMLLERLRDEDDYMSIKDYNAIAFDLRVDASQIKAVVEDFGLFVFTEDGKYFYSEGFNSRMAIKDEKSKRRSEAGKKGASKRWNNSKAKPAVTTENNSDIAKLTDKNSNAIAKPSENNGKKSKVKKSKVNKTHTNNARVSGSVTDAAREYFTLNIWPLFGKKTQFDPAFEAYYEDLLEGATNENIIEALKNLAEYYRINKTQQRYMVNPRTYFEERRYTDTLDLTPPKDTTTPAPYQNHEASQEDVQWSSLQGGS